MRRRVRPWQRSFLGFTVTDEPQPRLRIADKAVARFKDRVRDLTRRHRGVGLQRMIADLNPLLRGWPDPSGEGVPDSDCPASSTGPRRRNAGVSVSSQ
jgi:hypothetical protein